MIYVKFVEKDRELSEIANCTFSPHGKFVMRVSPGEEVQLETYDCFANAVRPGHDLAKALQSRKKLFDNPVTGPIHVEGAEPGDTLRVDIVDIKVPDIGLTTVMPGFGALEGWLTTCPPLTKFSTIKDGKVHYRTDHGKELSFPLKPFIGTIGVAPPTESISTLTPHKHGGNMDVADVCAGNRLYLPVGVKGALFAAGDVHATQGDGEICGTAVEIPAVLTVKFNVIKGKSIEWPRIESAEEIMTVASARPLEDAARLAFRELIHWLNADYGFSTYDAYMLLSLTAKARIAQIVDPLYTVVAKFSKEYLNNQ
jgi:acetamidase/formamidase